MRWAQGHTHRSSIHPFLRPSSVRARGLTIIDRPKCTIIIIIIITFSFSEPREAKCSELDVGQNETFSTTMGVSTRGDVRTSRANSLILRLPPRKLENLRPTGTRGAVQYFNGPRPDPTHALHPGRFRGGNQREGLHLDYDARQSIAKQSNHPKRSKAEEVEAMQINQPISHADSPAD